MFQKDLFILDGTFLDMNNNTDPNLSAIDPIDDYKVSLYRIEFMVLL